MSLTSYLAAPSRDCVVRLSARARNLYESCLCWQDFFAFFYRERVFQLSVNWHSLEFLKKRLQAVAAFLLLE